MTRHAVILLHGLARTSASLRRMDAALSAAGYTTVNVNYPSRERPIAELSEMAITQTLGSPALRDFPKVNFVTHSMGGILLRDYAGKHGASRIGRAIMLGPPNQGSELVDKLGSWRLSRPIFQQINGPAGNQLGTDASAVPNRLGNVTFPLGVIAGNRSINWINSLLIPGADDGKVSVERSKISGMTDHIVLPTTHPMMMNNRSVIRQTLHFLEHGCFAKDSRNRLPDN